MRLALDVPTRLLSEQPPSTTTNPASLLANLLFPPPIRFLSAQPARYRSSNATPPGPDDPTSEDYVCCFCDYELFYGSSAQSKKAVEKRKKMLARRRRAKERASGVANGSKKATNTKTKKGRKAGGEGEDERRPEGNSMGLHDEEGEEEWDCDEDEDGRW